MAEARVGRAHHDQRMLLELGVGYVLGIHVKIEHLAHVVVGIELIFGGEWFEELGHVMHEPARALDSDRLVFFVLTYMTNDHAGELVYLAPTRVNLGLTEERWPEIEFLKTRENLAA